MNVRFYKRKHKNQCFYLYLLSLLLCIIILYFTCYDLYNYLHAFTATSNRIRFIEDSNLSRYLKFHDDSKRIFPSESTNRWDIIKYMYDLYSSFHYDTSSLLVIKERCKTLSDFEKVRIVDHLYQISDFECRAEWMYYLETANVIEINNMMGFGAGKKGAFEVIFEDGRRAMYKPCGSSGEWPENEVRASHIDFALGFNRAPPSVMRNFSISYLDTILERTSNSIHSSIDSKRYILNQLKNTCSDNGILYGSIIGWINDLQSTKTIKKRFKDGITQQDIEEYRKTLSPSYLADILQNHLFFYILGTVRSLGYNEYKISNGSLLTVDLDRLTFSNLESISITSLSVCYICKIDKITLELLQDAFEDSSLGITVQHSLLYDPQQLVLSSGDAKTLHQRINHFFNKCYNTCIQRYGVDDVII